MLNLDLYLIFRTFTTGTAGKVKQVRKKSRTKTEKRNERMAKRNEQKEKKLRDQMLSEDELPYTEEKVSSLKVDDKK